MAVNSPAKQTKEATLRWLVLAVLLLGFALRVYHLGTQSMWWDETKTIERSLLPLPKMFDEIFGVRDQVPLYFMLMKGWLRIGQSAFVARFFSLLGSIITLAFVYQLGRKAVNSRVGLTAAFLLAINPFHVWYSQEARMYTLLVMTITAAHLFLFYILKRDAWFYWVGYSLAMVTAVYIHLFALLILMAHYIFFALHYRYLKQLFLKWIGYTVIVGLLFTVWGFFYLQAGDLQVATPPWIVGTKWYEPVLSLISFSAGRTIDIAQPIFYLTPLLYLITALVNFSRSRLRLNDQQLDAKNYQAFISRLTIIWLAVPLLLIFIVSLDWPSRARQVSIYTDRYLIIVLPALIILVAWGLNQLSQKNIYIFPIALVLIIIGSVPGLYNNYFQPQYGREDWQAAVSLLTADTLATDLILIQNDYQTPIAYYLDESRLQAQWIVVGALDDTTADFEAEMTERATVMQAQGQRVWLVTQFYNNDLHGFPQQRNSEVAHTAAADAQYAWMQAHFPILKDESFVGIRLTLFDLSNP